MNKKDFGTDFKWGVSTSAFQIEGAHDADGKGKTIWDIFTETPGNIKNNQHAKETTNFYHHYANDIKQLEYLNIPNFRLSISWARILPNGTGPINESGIAYYQQLLETLRLHNIEPWVTIYHWDLPHDLEILGGWTNRKIIDWFKAFINVCIQYFGHLVKYWMVLNEPMVFTGAGYFLGVHAPGKKGFSNFLPAAHHAVLCQAIGINLLKSKLPDACVGTTFSCSMVEPFSLSNNDIHAAERIDKLINRFFIEPLLGLGYPFINKSINNKLNKYILPGDELLMQANADFIGIQNYTREIVKHSWYTPYLFAKIVEAKKRNTAITEMNWEIYPEAIYHILKKFSHYSSIKKIIITENGAAFKDEIIDGEINDQHRLDFIKSYLKQVLRAKVEGVPVDGYFIWSLLDNFEWAEGYKPRFGIIHIDFETQKRTLKSSAYWYKDFLADKNV